MAKHLRYVAHHGSARIEVVHTESLYGLSSRLGTSATHMETWEAAHRILVTDAERRLAKAQKELEAAEALMMQVCLMRPPV